MKSILAKRKKLTVAFLLLLFATSLFAQDAKPVVKEQQSNDNLLALLLIAVTLILAFVIAGMGRVLLQIGKLLLEKSRAEKNNAQNAVKALMLTGVSLLAAQTLTAQDAETVTKIVPNYGGLSATLFYTFVSVIGLEVIVIVTLWYFIRKLYAELRPEKQAAVVKKNPAFAAWWNRLDKKLFTRAVPVATEADVMLDHDYDGIKELDNALPPWWKYGFYITIAVAVFYLFNFHVSGKGKNPTEEYMAEMEYAKEQKAIYDAQNKDKVDEANVPMADEAGIAKAKSLFMTNCISCHGDKGQGLTGAGPNLTDDYWLHKGSLNDIYQSIKHGYPDKGMQPWIQKFNPKEISQLASFVKTLHGTKPPSPKEPQGELYVEETKPADTVKPAGAIKDTLNIKK